MYTIDTPRDVIRVLGGYDHIASRLGRLGEGRARSAVGMWVTNGRVSAGHHIKVLVSLQAKGFKLEDMNPELFNLASWRDAMIAKVVPRTRKRSGHAAHRQAA